MKYEINKRVLWKVIDDEVVIVDPEKDDYSYLNNTGKDIWEMIAKGYEMEKIVEQLCEMYDGTAVKIGDDAHELIQDLLKANLIVKN